MNQTIHPATSRLLIKALLLLNKKRFTITTGGLDSYEVAFEISNHLTQHGINWLDPNLQPPPASNLRK
jgi:hypothetical protein